MNTVFSPEELEKYLREATIVSPDHPVVISQFISNAKELEIDGVAKNGEIIIEAISEHIENAGIHSGDATIVLPPQRLIWRPYAAQKKSPGTLSKPSALPAPSISNSSPLTMPSK